MADRIVDMAGTRNHGPAIYSIFSKGREHTGAANLEGAHADGMGTGIVIGVFLAPKEVACFLRVSRSMAYKMPKARHHSRLRGKRSTVCPRQEDLLAVRPEQLKEFRR